MGAIADPAERKDERFSQFLANFSICHSEPLCETWASSLLLFTLHIFALLQWVTGEVCQKS